MTDLTRRLTHPADSGIVGYVFGATDPVLSGRSIVSQQQRARRREDLRRGAALGRGLCAGLRCAGLALVAVLCVPQLSQARDQASLQGLTIPAARVPDWLDIEALLPDTGSWTRVPVHARDCADNSTSDRDALAGAIASAPARSVLVLDGGGCVYNIEIEFRVTRSELVILGAGMNQTILLTRENQILVVDAEVLEPERAWTAGFAMGTRTLTLASAAGLAVGDYLKLSAGLPAGAVARQGDHSTFAKIAAIAGSQITLDIGLPTSFQTSAQTAARFVPLRKFGIENLTLRHGTPTANMAYRPLLRLRGVAESWVRGVRFEGIWSHALGLAAATRVLVQANIFADQLKPDPWNKAALKLNEATSGNQIEKNVFQGTEVSIELENGAAHNIVAYNYIADPDGPCERGIFLHNDYAAANLFEGNDIACPAQWDDYWGSSGPHNTFFRNRLRDGAEMLQAQYAGRLGGEYLRGLEHLAYNLLANHVVDLAGGPQPTQNVDSHGRDFWIERNVYTGLCSLAQSAGSVAPECRSSGPPLATNTTWRSNHHGDAAPSAWSAVSIPASLYRSQAPSWWCQESGAFPNVGAPTDDASGSPPAYPKLPAQRLAEGLSCTLNSASLAAPILLDP